MKLFSVILISVFLGSVSSFAEYAKPMDFVPYPWGMETPFPWKNVQGVWTTNIGSMSTYYTFEVVGQSYSKDKQLLIKQYDLKTCDIVAVGVGVESENKTIWAHMKPMFLPKPYRLGLRSFSADVLPKYLPNVNGRVMVMSISSLESLKSNYYPMQKMNNSIKSRLAVQCKRALQ